MTLIDRTDYRITRGLLLLVAVLAPLLGVAAPLALWLTGDALERTTTYGGGAPLPDATAAHRATVTTTDAVRLSIPDAPTHLWLLTILPTLLLAVCVTVVVLQLRQVVGTIAVGDSFVPANRRRLRVVGATLIVGSIVVPTVDAIVNHVLTQYAVAEATWGLTIQLSLAWLLTGVVALILAEAFGHGRVLADDVAGLV